MFGIIVNPVSGGGKNKTLTAQVEALLEERGIAHRLFATENEGDGGHQTRLALDAGCDALFVL